MKLWPTTLFCIASLAGPVGARAGAASRRPGPVGTVARLRALAARASGPTGRTGWKPLRRYAESARDVEQQGCAYLVLGYREYQARDFAPATADLARAAANRFSLADFAEFYKATAALDAGDAAHAAAALAGFSARFPQSTLRHKALETLARAYLEAHEPGRAIEALKADPATARQPGLALLLAQAYHDAGQFPEAVEAFQDIYFGFPTSAESAAAGESLVKLASALGAAFPQPTEQAETARAEALVRSGRAAEALKEFDALLAERPASARAWDWKLARAQCLIALKRFHDAVESLAGAGPPESKLGGERLAILVNAYASLDDQDSMLQSLDQLAALDPQSAAYAAALSHAGYFFFRHGDWAQTARFDTALAELPAGPIADKEEAEWRTAWADYLQGQSEAARAAMLAYVRRYPASSRAPVALYWLGRISQTAGALPEADALYALLVDRFPNSYYAGEAIRQRGKTTARGRAVGHAAGDADTQTTLVSVAVELAAMIPLHPAPSVELCPARQVSPALRPFETLQTLSLDDLAERYLRLELGKQPASPELLLALARFEAARANYSAALFATRKLVPDFADYRFPQLPKEIWQQLYPTAYWKLVRREARAERLDPYLVMGLIRQESAFNSRATSEANARGLMQMRPGTAETLTGGRRHRRRGTSPARLAEQLYSPAYNIRLSCRYLRRLVKMFNGSTEEALAAYNAGDDRAREWLARGPFPEPAAFVESIPFGDTRVYVESVLRDAVVYRAMLGGTPKFRRCQR
ncbi:MAG TPA: transglycosylase SLT domain-containing protein [Terriglobia bacterium]|nr:transglycosylase SLT domain-containing protein [Terriglobia bacterium]